MDQSRETISVVVPCRDAAATLGQQLEALGGQAYEGPWEVVIVDNGSTDETAEVAEAYCARFPNMRLCTANERAGANYCRNAGVRDAKGSRILFADADDEVSPGWLEAMARAYDEGAEIVAGPTVSGKLNRHAPYRAGRPDRPGPPIRRAARRLLRRPARTFLESPVGANCGVKKEVWEALGGFDEAYAYGGTEREFFWRAQLAGHRVTWVDGAVVEYRQRETLPAVRAQAYAYGQGSARLYRDFRPHGHPRPSVLGAVLEWAEIAMGAPLAAVSRRHRGVWARRAAFRWGRLTGSVRYRVFAP